MKAKEMTRLVRMMTLLVVGEAPRSLIRAVASRSQRHGWSSKVHGCLEGRRFRRVLNKEKMIKRVKVMSHLLRARLQMLRLRQFLCLNMLSLNSSNIEL